MRIDRRWRQAISDDDREVAWTTVATCQRLLRSRIELSSEIRAPQIILAILDTAGHLKRLQSKRIQTGNDSECIELGMDGIAGTRMIEREFK